MLHPRASECAGFFDDASFIKKTPEIGQLIHNAWCVVQACAKMTTTLRSVRHAACVALVLGLVTCSAETPADAADRLSKDGESVTQQSGVDPDISAELVLKDLMLWMRDNHDLAPLLHPENSEWLERFAPRGPSGERTVALSFALRSALSREIEKAAMLQEGFGASSPGKTAEARPEESSCVAEREDTTREMEDLRRALSSARAEADERQRALEEELREKKRAHDEVRALYESSLLAARDAEERSAADPMQDVDAESGSEINPVAAVLEEDGDAVDPEPPVEEADAVEPESMVETTDGFDPEPMVETTDAVDPEPMVETIDAVEPEPMVEKTDGFEPEPMVETIDAVEPEPMVETIDAVDPEPPADASDAVEPDDPTPYFSPPDEPTPGTDVGTDENTWRRIVGGVHAVATKTVAAVYPVFEWLARLMMRSSLGVKLSQALDAAASKLEMTASAVDAYLGTSLAYPSARFRTAVEGSLAVFTLAALLTARWIARAWYDWTFKQRVTPKDASRRTRLEGTDAPRGGTEVERSDGGGPVAGARGYHSSATLRHRPHPTPTAVPTPHGPTPTAVPMHRVPTRHVPTPQAPTQWRAMPTENAPPPRAAFPPGPASDARFRASGPPPVQMRRGPPPRVNPVFTPHG